jgi:peptidoglycan hydrolase-like protein with peptidoglycan-binding domain
VLTLAPASSATDYSQVPLSTLRQDCLNQGYRTSPYAWGPAQIPSTTVQYGSTGICVALAQALLDAKASDCAISGGSNLQIDGQDGPLTNTAVNCFQKRVGIEADGQVGPDTWSYLWYVD